PFDHLYGSSVFRERIELHKKNLVVVSPDVGGIKIARAYAKMLDCALVVIDKRRPKQNIAEVMNIIGEVDGKDILIVDDLIDTGGTIVGAIEALKNEGALEIYGAITHSVLSGNALDRIRDSHISRLYVSDTINIEGINQHKNIEVISSADLFAEAIRRTYNNESISSLFHIDKG
ncbi:MAG: ribose-phosphate diphosphokinase, partial [Chlorobium sp.]|nr:ribose-phosphate diphosphokinase [Chlorobium sp.]